MRLTLVAAGVALGLTVLFGCSRRPAAQKSDKLVLAVIPKSTGSEFWKTVEGGAREAANELGVEIRWEGPIAETEIVEQNKIIENMVNVQVAGIALAPLNPKAMRQPVENAVAAKIPVVIFDSAVDGDAHVSFVATDNRKGGQLGAQHLAKRLGERKGKLFLMRFIQGTASTEARAEGFLEAAKAAGLEVVADVYSEEASDAGCKKAAANALERFVKDGHLNVDGVFACNDRSTRGMLEALNDLRKSNVKVNARFVGFDFDPTMIQALKEGTIDALVVQNPRKMGYLAVKTLVEHLRGQKVEPRIDTGVEVVTRQRLGSDPAIRHLVGAGTL
jgi:ribose transport system substrate-binding protein